MTQIFLLDFVAQRRMTQILCAEEFEQQITQMTQIFLLDFVARRRISRIPSAVNRRHQPQQSKQNQWNGIVNAQTK